MNNSEYIYIVLVKALTGLGKFSRKISKYEYTHVAVALDDELEDFITFSRKKHYSPFDAGFMHEKREHYAFGENEKVKVKIFRVPVLKTDLDEIKEYIDKIQSDKEYIFNFYSMMTMPIVHGFRIYKAHNCMSFVSKVIQLSNSAEMDKAYYKYNIKDIDKLLRNYFFTECYLEKNKDDNEYMRREGIVQNIKKFFILNGKLFYRMLLKENDRYE